MQKVKLPKNIVRYVEHNLYYYHEYLRDIERLRKDILYGRDNNDENVGGGRPSLPGKPTERIATNLAMNKRLGQLEQIVKAIDDVYQSLPDERKKLIQLRYWTSRQYRWEQKMTWKKIANEIHISERQALRWRDEIVYAIAEKLGWR